MERVALYPLHHKISYSCFIWIFGLGLFLFLILHNLLNYHYETFYQFSNSTQFLDAFFFHVEHNQSGMKPSSRDVHENTFLKKIILMKNKK